MKEIVVNDQLIKYDVVGNGETTIVFLHGWRSELGVWRDTVDKLPLNEFKSYLIDLPGFGQSPAPKTPHSVEKYADLIYTFAQQQKLQKFILVGHSFGGRIAIKLAMKYPEIVEKLILVDSAGIKKEHLSREKVAKIVKPLFKPKFMHGLREKIYQKIGAEDYIATPEMTETYLKIVEEDLAPDLKNISQPTLIVWGGDDTSTPISDAKIMNEKIKNSKLEIIERAGHFSFLDQPDKFFEIFENFIK